MTIDLGEQSDIDVVNGVIELQNKIVADIGCGDASFAANLAQNGATVTGVEPDPVQAKANQHCAPIDGLELIEAGAQKLPFADASQDSLIFRFSFHHIPGTLHAQVFKEAARVLKPRAKLFIIEPLASGPANHVMELFHDEARVRAEVQAALKNMAPRYFEHQQTYAYQITRSFASFSAYCERYSNLTYNNYQPNSVEDQAVNNRFSEFEGEDGSADLLQPIKADLFIKC